MKDYSQRLFGLSQEIYINNVLNVSKWIRLNLDTFVEKENNLSIDLCPESNKERKDMALVPYASAKGNQLYAMMCTHLDIFVSLISGFQSNPRHTHWQAVNRILCYLRGVTDSKRRYMFIWLY